MTRQLGTNGFVHATKNLSCDLAKAGGEHLVHTLQRADTLRERYRDLIGVLLIEHASTVLDEEPLKVRKGGVTPYMKAWAKMRFSKGARTEDLLREIREGAPLSNSIGLDPPISAKGIRQSELLGELVGTLRDARLIADPDTDIADSTTYTSTHRRTIETSGHAGLGWSTHELPELDERLMLETHGLPTAEVMRRHPEFLVASQTGGELVHSRIEPRDHFEARTESGLLRVMFEMDAQKGPGGKWVPIVMHQSNIRIALAHLYGPDVCPWEIPLRNAGVTALLLRSRPKTPSEKTPRPRWRELELGITSPDPSDPHDPDLLTVWSEHFPDGWNHIAPGRTYEGCVVAQNYGEHLESA